MQPGVHSQYSRGSQQALLPKNCVNVNSKKMYVF